MGIRATADYNLSVTHPHLCAEWHTEKNGDLRPDQVSRGSSKNRVWWQCTAGHAWQATVSNRTKGTGCPYCAGKIAYDDRNLAVIHPDVAAQWHPTLNGDLRPNQVAPATDKIAWWQCSAGHAWQASVCGRIKGRGCPYCTGQRATDDRNLAVIHPDVAAQWHPTLNGDLRPNQITPSSGKRYWWQCSAGHAWQASASSRASGCGCPFCSNLRALPTTCLATTHPELAREWSSTNRFTPNDVTAGSQKQVRWICEHGHEWSSTVKNRTRGCGCPTCRVSKGENAVAATLDRLGMRYVREFKLGYTIDGRKRNLRFDFAVATGDHRFMIEYHGEQHTKAVRRFGGQKALEATIRRDHIKREACRRHGIPLLEIHYSDFNNIGALVGEFIGRLGVDPS